MRQSAESAVRDFTGAAPFFVQALQGLGRTHRACGHESDTDDAQICGITAARYSRAALHHRKCLPVTAAIGLKRLAIVVISIAAAAFVTLIGLSFLMPAAAVRDAVKAEIHAVTGLDPVLRGDVAVSLFPSGTVTFHNVMLGDEKTGEPAVVADALTARLRYFPLLGGRIEIADVTLLRPTIAVTFLPDGRSNWAGLITALAHALEPDRDRSASFSEIGIEDGTIIVRDTARGLVERLSGADFQVAWPSISRSFGANGHFVWHDQPLEASFALSDFLAALTGDRSGVKIRVAGTPLKLAFDGAASDRSTLKLAGTLGVESPSLRDAMMWAGNDRLPFGGFGRFALRAQSELVDGMIALSNVNVELDGNSAEGALTLATNGQRIVQGTLAADALDLTPYVSGVRLVSSEDRGWARLPLVLDGFDDLNLDLRLSAASIKISNARLGRTAVAATMHDGKLDLTIGESQAFGGVAKGSLGLGSAAGGIAVHSNMQFVDVDLDDCLGQIFNLHKLTGRGTLGLNIEGAGNSVFAVTRALNGTATVNARNGALSGIDVEQLLRRLERRPLSGNGDFRSGQTPFDQLAVSLKITAGTVSVDDMRFEGPSVRLAVGGQASVPARDLDLKGVATLMSTASDNTFELPFVVQGRWDDPIMLPDAQILIRRSDAAAPLLNGAKPRSASDAVHAVIDQLLAKPPAGSPAIAPGVSSTSTPAPADGAR
jgi:AsmA protein